MFAIENILKRIEICCPISDEYRKLIYLICCNIYWKANKYIGLWLGLGLDKTKNKIDSAIFSLESYKLC